MKRLHLICNAHLDPIWLWEWEEGLASVLSTFRSACDLAEQFDYVFCHNEALLYEWVEEYDPELFKRIRKKVKEGKWRIMGGWYLQPDCNMPSGESFVRQALVGKNYFRKKFGAEPNTAVNFDPFGHSVGLVQILRKCGYQNYLCCRPSRDEFPSEDLFEWEGVDGSRVKVARVSSNYNTLKGQAIKKIRDVLGSSARETDVVLWGVGNHGGGPSAKDLRDIAELVSHSEEEIIHSWPERFFADAEPTQIIHGSLNPCMPGCYASMVVIKQMHRALENEIYATEKILSHAALSGMPYPKTEMDNVIRTLLYSEFHDILPGTCIEEAKIAAKRLLSSGLEQVNRLRTRAFFYLMSGQKKAKPEEFPILIYNPHPFVLHTTVEVAFNLEDQNWSDEYTDIFAYCGEQRLQTQVIREKSNLNLDWMKRIVFDCELLPMSLNRFDCRKMMRSEVPKTPDVGKSCIFDNGNLRAEVDGATGLLRNVDVGGKNYLSQAGRIDVYATNEDPWAMSVEQRKRLGVKEGSFVLATPERGSEISGLLHRVIPSVRIIEQGDVLTKSESVFVYKNSYACVRYSFYRSRDEIDVELILNFNEKNKMVKWNLPVPFAGKTIAQIAYGQEEAEHGEAEHVMQKWVCRAGAEQSFAVLNDGIYAFSCDDEGLHLTLMRNTMHAAHPIPGRELIRQDRFYPGTESGETVYHFRLLFGDGTMREELDSAALAFNEKAFGWNIFPSGFGKLAAEKIVTLDNPKITLTAFKQSEAASDKYILRLFNGTPQAQEAMLTLFGRNVRLSFGKFEIKTLCADAYGICELQHLEI